MNLNLRAQSASFALCLAATLATGPLVRAQSLDPPAPVVSSPVTPSQPPAGGQQMQTGGLVDPIHGPVKRAKSEPSASLTVTVEGRSETFSPQQLAGMAQRTITVQNGHLNTQETYTGVAVSDLLARLGVSTTVPAQRNRVLASFLRATGTDFYFVVYSGVELMSSMHTGDVIVATQRNGQPLADAGEFMLVSSEDKQPARWVHNLTSMTLSQVN